MDRRIMKTKTAIQNAYMTLIAEGEESKITISSIARIANIDRKTFYSHYTCVEDILREMWQDRIQELINRLQQTACFSSLNDLIPIYHTLDEIIHRDYAFYCRLASNTCYVDFWNEIHRIAIDALIKSFKDKLSIPQAELRMYFEFFVSGVIRLYQEHLRDPDIFRVETMWQIINEIVQHGSQRLYESCESRLSE